MKKNRKKTEKRIERLLINEILEGDFLHAFKVFVYCHLFDPTTNHLWSAVCHSPIRMSFAGCWLLFAREAWLGADTHVSKAEAKRWKKKNRWVLRES